MVAGPEPGECGEGDDLGAEGAGMAPLSASALTPPLEAGDVSAAGSPRSLAVSGSGAAPDWPANSAALVGALDRDRPERPDNADMGAIGSIAAAGSRVVAACCIWELFAAALVIAVPALVTAVLRSVAGLPVLVPVALSVLEVDCAELAARVVFAVLLAPPVFVAAPRELGVEAAAELPPEAIDGADVDVLSMALIVVAAAV
jgi:hypothetical protein